MTMAVPNTHNGFTGSQMMIALLGGAAAGAVAAYLLKGFARDARDQITGVVDESTEALRHLPAAVKVAGTAARTAFVKNMRQDAEV
jgi:hypothetical protein